MKEYRMCVDASICFNVPAKNRRTAKRIAKELVDDMQEGLLVFLPSEKYDLPDDARLYVGDAKTISVESEWEAKT
jgi:hypothetical protein